MFEEGGKLCEDSSSNSVFALIWPNVPAVLVEG